MPTPLPDDRVDHIQEQWRRERPDLDPTPQGVIGRLHRLADRLHDELITVYREHGLGEGDFDVLASLRRTGAPFELPAGELARHTMVTTGAMTKRIDRLEAAGLVTRTPDASDGRGRRIGLTAGDIDHDHHRPVETGTEPFGEEIVGPPRRVLFGSVAGIGEPEAHTEEWQCQHDQDGTADDQCRPGAGLDQPAPPVPEGARPVALGLSTVGQPEAVDVAPGEAE